MIKSLVFITLVFVSTLYSCSSNTPVKKNTNIVNADEIISLINEGKDVFLENKTIKGVIDFTKTKNANMESKGVSRFNIRSSLTFMNCIFMEKIIGYSSNDTLTNLVSYQKNFSCIACEFREDVILRESNFYGTVNFSEASFVLKGTFEGSNFLTGVYFSKTSFSDEVRFQNAVFHNKVNFMESIFGKTLSFQGAVFKDDVQFSVSKFLAYADFSLVSFSSGCFFNYAVFSNQAIFNNALFKGRAEFVQAEFSGNTEFKNCIFYNLAKYNEAIINNTFSFQNATFLFSKPEMGNYKRKEQTKIIFDKAKASSFEFLTEKDF